jgi:hypothetical protein
MLCTSHNLIPSTSDNLSEVHIRVMTDLQFFMPARQGDQLCTSPGIATHHCPSPPDSEKIMQVAKIFQGKLGLQASE